MQQQQIALSNEHLSFKEEGRSVWLMATLRPFGLGVKRNSHGGPQRTVQRNID